MATLWSDSYLVGPKQEWSFHLALYSQPVVDSGLDVAGHS